MFLIDFTAFIQQFIPIHWRSTYREHLCKVLLSPLISVYQRLIRYRKHIHNQPLSYLQVGVLAYYLNADYARIGYTYIEIIDTNTPASFRINVHPVLGSKRKDIETFLQSKIPVGIKWKLTFRE